MFLKRSLADIKIIKELDNYERNYATVNNLKYIEYSPKYVNGFINITKTNEYNKEEYISYIKKMLIIFDRVNKSIYLKIKVSFNHKDTIKLCWKIICDISIMREFLKKHKCFRNVLIGRVKHFEEEIKEHSNEHNLIYFTKEIKCIKDKLNRMR